MKNEKYRAILTMERPVSRSHPPLSMQHRAAQFSPFAALTGYDEAVKEAGRLTSERVELADHAREELDRVLCALEESGEPKRIAVEHFVPDERKSGGCYVRTVGTFRRLDRIYGRVELREHPPIAVEDIRKVEAIEE